MSQNVIKTSDPGRAGYRKDMLGQPQKFVKFNLHLFRNMQISATRGGLSGVHREKY